jgi:hypothetical protein
MIARTVKIIAFLIGVVLFSCEKGQHVSCIQNDYYAYLDNYQVGSICTENLCNNYQTIWKELFMEKNSISENYFNNHVEICRSQIHDWVDGASFNICYKIKVDWAIAYNCDQFIIKIEKDNTDYPSLILPRDTYLSKENIRTVTSKRAFSSYIEKVSNNETVDFNYFNDALKYLIKKAGVNTLCSTMIMIDESTGDLILEAYAQYDDKDNECIRGRIDLMTRETFVTDEPCAIN